MKTTLPTLRAMFPTFYQEKLLEDEGLPDAYLELAPGGKHVVLRARSKAKWLIWPIDIPSLPEEAGEIVGIIEVLVQGMIAEATELPDDPMWIAQREEELERKKHLFPYAYGRA